MHRKNAETLLQLLCLMVVAFGCASYIAGGADVPARAEGLCSEPPLKFEDSWPSGTNVIVKIDSAWESSEREALEAGNKRWNSNPSCSNVNFSGFEPQAFENYDAIPPERTLYWQRATPGTNYNGGVLNHYLWTPKAIE